MAAVNKDSGWSPGALVWAHVKGFPHWPARIVDPEEAPQNVLQARKPGQWLVSFLADEDNYAWLRGELLLDLSSKFEELARRPHRNKKWNLAVEEARMLLGGSSPASMTPAGATTAEAAGQLPLPGSVAGTRTAFLAAHPGATPPAAPMAATAATPAAAAAAVAGLTPESTAAATAAATPAAATPAIVAAHTSTAAAGAVAVLGHAANRAPANLAALLSEQPYLAATAMPLGSTQQHYAATPTAPHPSKRLRLQHATTVPNSSTCQQPAAPVAVAPKAAIPTAAARKAVAPKAAALTAAARKAAGPKAAALQGAEQEAAVRPPKRAKILHAAPAGHPATHSGAAQQQAWLAEPTAASAQPFPADVFTSPLPTTTAVAEVIPPSQTPAPQPGKALPPQQKRPKKSCPGAERPSVTPAAAVLGRETANSRVSRPALAALQLLRQLARQGLPALRPTQASDGGASAAAGADHAPSADAGATSVVAATDGVNAAIAIAAACCAGRTGGGSASVGGGSSSSTVAGSSRVTANEGGTAGGTAGSSSSRAGMNVTGSSTGRSGMHSGGSSYGGSPSNAGLGAVDTLAARLLGVTVDAQRQKALEELIGSSDLRLSVMPQGCERQPLPATARVPVPQALFECQLQKLGALRDVPRALPISVLLQVDGQLAPVLLPAELHYSRTSSATATHTVHMTGLQPALALYGTHRRYAEDFVVLQAGLVLIMCSVPALLPKKLKKAKAGLQQGPVPVPSSAGGDLNPDPKRPVKALRGATAVQNHKPRKGPVVPLHGSCVAGLLGDGLVGSPASSQAHLTGKREQQPKNGQQAQQGRQGRQSQQQQQPPPPPQQGRQSQQPQQPPPPQQGRQSQQQRVSDAKRQKLCSGAPGKQLQPQQQRGRVLLGPAQQQQNKQLPPHGSGQQQQQQHTHQQKQQQQRRRQPLLDLSPNRPRTTIARLTAISPPHLQLLQDDACVQSRTQGWLPPGPVPLQPISPFAPWLQPDAQLDWDPLPFAALEGEPTVAVQPEYTTAVAPTAAQAGEPGAAAAAAAAIATGHMEQPAAAWGGKVWPGAARQMHGGLGSTASAAATAAASSTTAAAAVQRRATAVLGSGGVGEPVCAATHGSAVNAVDQPAHGRAARAADGAAANALGPAPDTGYAAAHMSCRQVDAFWDGASPQPAFGLPAHGSTSPHAPASISSLLLTPAIPWDVEAALLGDPCDPSVDNCRPMWPGLSPLPSLMAVPSPLQQSWYGDDASVMPMQLHSSFPAADPEGL